MAAGESVVYLDEENGENRMAERLAVLGVTPELADERFFYFWEPRLSMPQRDRLRASLQEVKPALVVFDSAAHFFVWAGLDENNNLDAVKWYTQYVFGPCAEVGAASVVIDHDTRRPSVDGARGAGAKQQVTEISYKVTRRSRFNRETAGGIDVDITKDRDGHLSLGRSITLGGTPFEFAVSAKDVQITRAKSGNALKGDAHAQAVLEWFRKCGRGATQTEAAKHFAELPKGAGYIAASTVKRHIANLSAQEDAETRLRREPREGADLYYYERIEAS
jgi:hypothetical protein